MLVYEWLITPFLEFPFLRRALVASIMIALSSGLVGALMMLNRMSLVGDALSHGILPGVAIGFLIFGFNLVAMSVGGITIGLVIALLAAWVSTKTRLRHDASFTAFYLISLSLGVIIVSKSGTQTDLFNILFGSVVAIDRVTLIFIWAVLVVTLLLLAVIYRPLLAELVDPIFLKVHKQRGARYYRLFLFLIMLNLMASFQALGSLMAVGLMMLPPIAARLWARRMETIFLLTLLFGMIASYGGLLMSYHFRVPSGPAIIGSAGFIFAISLVLVTTIRYGERSRRDEQ